MADSRLPSFPPSGGPRGLTAHTAADEIKERFGRLREKARMRPFLAVMCMTAILAGLYYFVIAAPLYASTSRFAIRSKTATTAANAASVLNLGGNNAGGPDLIAVQNYIESQPMLVELDRRHHLRKDYTAPRLDLLRRLSPKASREDFLTFYRKQVVVRIDRDGDMVEIEVRAFDRDTALAVSKSILDLSEDFIDQLSERMRQESINSAIQAVAEATREAGDARAAQAAFRTANEDLNPAATASSTQGQVASLEAQINEGRAQLASLLTYSRPNAPAVQQLTAKMAELKRQLEMVRATQGAGGNNSLTGRLTQYEVLTANRDAAETKLKGAQQALDLARAASEQREKFVVRIVPPNLPDEATRPRRMIDFIVVMILVAAGYAITMLIIAGVRDHQGS